MTPPSRQRTGMVRIYTPTEGNAEPTRATRDETTLLFADSSVAREGLTPTAQQVMRLTLGGNLSLAEVSAHAKVPISIIRVVVSSLVASGHLIVRNPATAESQREDVQLLESILSGLRRL